MMEKIRKKISVFIILICIGTTLSSIDVSAASLDTVLIPSVYTFSEGVPKIFFSAWSSA